VILIAAVGKVSSDAPRLLGQPEELVRIPGARPSKAKALARAELEVGVGDLEVPATIDAAMQSIGTHVEAKPRTTEAM
jgi:uncharacterized protein YbjT (DUF2867 family)